MGGRRSRHGRRRGPVTVERARDQRVTEAERVTETVIVTDEAPGARLLEAKGTDDAGGRVFAAQLIAVGTSRNGVRYRESVLRAAAPLYDGAKAYDHHRSPAELATSTVNGLVGGWRNIEARPDGLYGDLHLLPSATHVAESLDASLSAVASGGRPLVGFSHDVQMRFSEAVDDTGRRIRDAQSISAVFSTDVVADPSAGGRVIRMVAGGFETEDLPEPAADTSDRTTTSPSKEDTMTLKELLALLKAAKGAEERDALLKEHAAVLDAAGFTAEDVPVLLGDPDPGGEPEPKPAEAPTPTPADVPAPAAPADPPSDTTLPAAQPVAVGVQESRYGRQSMIGRFMVHEALKARSLPDAMADKLATRLPERFTEAELVAEVNRTAEILEASGLDVPAPRGSAAVRVTEEAQDKARKRLEATFAGDWVNGFTRLSEAFFAVTGEHPGRWFDDTAGMAHHIVRESWGGPTAGDGGGFRATEALTTTSWGEVLADVMNKRLMMEYARPDLQLWSRLVTTSNFIDFRSQKIIRVGGYGTLPTVNEGAPYQELTSPTDEQVTYSPSKRGGIESYTWEMAINDDLRRLVAIPRALALAAAVTLNQAIWDIFTTNPNLADGNPLFDNTNHGNSASGTTLSETGLNTLRQKMRDQTAYGDQTGTPLGLTPDFLLVPNELEDQANKLTKGPALLPAGTSYASDQPNLHAGMEYIVVDRWTDSNDYIVMAGPTKAPTIEVGFLQGRVNPELFVQDDPTVGSMFSADKVTWKIRHVWGYGVLDHRAFQRMTN